MDIVLKSGHVLKNVETTDSTKSVIGLWIWSNNQARDQLLTFKNHTVLSSQIAAIEDTAEDVDITFPGGMR